MPSLDCVLDAQNVPYKRTWGWGCDQTPNNAKLLWAEQVDRAANMQAALDGIEACYLTTVSCYNECPDLTKRDAMRDAARVVWNERKRCIQAIAYLQSYLAGEDQEPPCIGCGNRRSGEQFYLPFVDYKCRKCGHVERTPIGHRRTR